jgi:hypothetical protein
MVSSSTSGFLADSETATVVSAEEYLVDWGDGSDDEEAAQIVSDQDGDSGADRASVSTGTYVWRHDKLYCMEDTVCRR